MRGPGQDRQNVLAGSSRPPELLSTHPSEETRIRQIDAWLPEALRSYTQPR